MSSLLLASGKSALDDEFFIPVSSFGAYGEMHYNMNQTGDGDRSKTLDFHRFVLFFSHGWSEKWSFKSELELEHNFVSDGEGELELEQAYVQYYNGKYGFQAGVLLPSVGIINEYHEPPLFLSVERPEYAKVIIPTTWFGNGAAIFGNIAGLDLKLTVMEGLDGDGIDSKYADGIRGGRVKGYKADAEELLTNFSVKYAGIPALKMGASLSRNKAVFSDTVRTAIDVNLMEINAQFNLNGLTSTFEYGQILYAEHSVEKSTGFYVDLGYDIATLMGRKEKIVPWVRYTALNPAGGHPKEDEKKYTKIMTGISVKPIDDVVFKFDYGVKTYAETSKEKVTQINLGVGYNF